MKKRVLVIEDDAAIRRGLADALAFAGYDTLEAANGDDGLRMAVRTGYDLLLLDLVLPGKSGFEILAEVRTTRPTMPVIILTARGEEADRVKGLRLGADDYVVKPFSVKELLARIEAVLRRTRAEVANTPRTFVCGDVSVDFNQDLAQMYPSLIYGHGVGHGKISSCHPVVGRILRKLPEISAGCPERQINGATFSLSRR